MTRHPDCEAIGSCMQLPVCVDGCEKENEMPALDEDEILSRAVGGCARAMHEAENQFSQLSDRERKIFSRAFLDGVRHGAEQMMEAVKS